MNNFYENYTKRIISILLSLILLILLFPLLLIISLMIFVKIGSPIFFTQYRPGKDEKIFKLIKFRTMSHITDDNGILLPDNERLSRFGLFLRKSSLDELPELLNILKGEMSFIGPRPLSIHYLPNYDDAERVRNSVRPGLTGLSQIRGRNNASWEDRIKYDLFYIENLTFLLDFKIFFSTFRKVLQHSDVNVRTKNDELKNFNVYKIVKEQKMKSGSEIGSFFEYDYIYKNNTDQSIYDYIINNKNELSFTISGRSAIELAIISLKKISEVKTAYLPAYCCISMVQPFLDNNIEVQYYRVRLDEENKVSIVVDTNKLKKNDIFLFMDYFGFNRIKIEKTLSELNKKGVYIIQDSTHSLFSEKNHFKHIDFQICSIRKWCAIPTGGFIASSKHKLTQKPSIDTNEVVRPKIEGMKLKTSYLLGSEISKEEFLILNSKFDNSLIRLNYENKIDDLSLKILKETSYEHLVSIRRRNATYLLKNINENKKVQLFYTDLKENEVPLFVPIKVEKEFRDIFRKKLIENGIYLPVHWPEKVGKGNEISDTELSIVCDQRYDIDDMSRIVEILNKLSK